MNAKKNAMAATVPVVRQLRKVPGFDPLKYLRTVSRNGEKVLKLDLSYKKLWFRLAFPNGRMQLNPLRITDQMAIFEAKVYASKDEASLLASFTSTQMTEDIPGGLYIRAAQEDALNEALENAGFGIQLCDVVQKLNSDSPGSEILLSQVEAAMQEKKSSEGSAAAPAAKVQEVPAASTAPVTKDSPSVGETAETAPSAAETDILAPVSQEAAAESTTNEAQHQAAAEQAVVEQTPAEQVAAENMEQVLSESEPQSQDETVSASQDAADEVLQNPAPAPEPATAAANAGDEAENAGDPAEQNEYEGMTVEEICARMTPEEARNILVPLGTCKGWTLDMVLDRRPTSLKWYIVGCAGASNVLKAGATLLWNSYQMAKAG